MRRSRRRRRWLGVVVGASTLCLFIATTAGCPSTDRLVVGARPSDGAAVPQDDAAADGASSSCEGADTQSNSAHCGRCGHDCLGGACDAGVCQPAVFATKVYTYDHELHLDDRGVLYWLDATGKAPNLVIRRCESASSCKAPVEAYVGTIALWGYALHHDELFVTEYLFPEGGATISEVYQAPLTGPRRLACEFSGSVNRIAITPSQIFATISNTLYACARTGGVDRNPAIVVSSGPDVPGTALLLSNDIGAIWTTPARRLVALDLQSNTRIQISEPIVLTPGPAGAAALRADRAVWFAERSAAGDDQALMTGTFPKMSETQLVGGVASIGGVALDEDAVYFTTLTAGSVERVAIDGGARDTVAKGQVEPSLVAVGPNAIYWYNASPTFTVMRLAK